MAKEKVIIDDGNQEIAILPEELQVKQTSTPGANKIANHPVKETVANIVLKLVDENRRGGAYLDGEDFVFDPNFDNGEGLPKGKQRAIRLLRGVNTIFVDEQEKITKEYIERNKLSLEFHKLGRQCVLSPHQKTHIQFATMCNSNIDNPHRFGVKPIYFTIWNPLAEEQKAQAETDLMLEAVLLAGRMPMEKMERHCVYLGIALADEFGEQLQEGRLRKKYVAYANKQPKTFLDSAENPEIDIAWAVKFLIKNGTIDIHKQEGQAYYKDGGYITSIPSGETAEKYLVKYAMTDAQPNREFAKRVKTLADV